MFSDFECPAESLVPPPLMSVQQETGEKCGHRRGYGCCELGTNSLEISAGVSAVDKWLIQSSEGTKQPAYIDLQRLLQPELG